jgi:hypothetical protein
MMDDAYPAWVCSPCGETWGRRPVNPHATWHPDTCGLCGRETEVTEPRDYGHLRAGWQDAISRLPETPLDNNPRGE